MQEPRPLDDARQRIRFETKREKHPAGMKKHDKKNDQLPQEMFETKNVNVVTPGRDETETETNPYRKGGRLKRTQAFPSPLPTFDGNQRCQDGWLSLLASR